jgi:Flp pilus assembly protein TadD
LVLLALIAYLEAQAPDRTAAVARRWHFASVLLFALSLLAKASGVALPLVLLLLDRYPMRRPWSRRLVWEKLPFFALSLAASLVAVFAQRDAGAMLTLEHGPPLQRVAQACYGLGFYLWKTVLPLHLSPLYEWDARMDVLAMKYVAPVACAIALTALAFARRRRWPALWTCWCCYVVMVLPVLGLFQSGPQLAADRYTYLPCLPWAILAAWGLGRLPGSRAARAAIGVAVIAALATLTWRYTLVFRDSTSLWNRVLRESPDSYIGHFNLGNALDADGHRELAVPHYEAAIALRPNEMKARHSLASDLLAQNDYRKAIELWQQTLAIEQTHPEVFQGLGSAYAALGDAPEAVRAFERALALDPTSPNALNGLGQLCWQSGDQKKAMEYWRKTIALHPDSVVAHNYLGVALLQRGQLKDAEAEFRTVLAQHAEDPDALTNLGALLLGQGKKDEAVACWKRALAADPTHPGARQNLERFGSR